MSAPTLQALVERYLVERRRLGFDLRKSAYALRSFARYVGAVGISQQSRGGIKVDGRNMIGSSSIECRFRRMSRHAQSKTH